MHFIITTAILLLSFIQLKYIFPFVINFVGEFKIVPLLIIGFIIISIFFTFNKAIGRSYLQTWNKSLPQKTIQNLGGIILFTCIPLILYFLYAVWFENHLLSFNDFSNIIVLKLIYTFCAFSILFIPIIINGVNVD